MLDQSADVSALRRDVGEGCFPFIKVKCLPYGTAVSRTDADWCGGRSIRLGMSAGSQGAY